MAGSAVIGDPHYTTPLYHKTEAAHIIAVPAQTFRDWAVGYARKRLDGSQLVSAPIVTTLEPARPQGVSVPFVGLAEAYIVAAFTKAGVPMRRIRPAVLVAAGAHRATAGAGEPAAADRRRGGAVGLRPTVGRSGGPGHGGRACRGPQRPAGIPPGRARLPDDGDLRGRLDAADPAPAVREGRGHRRPVAERRPADCARRGVRVADIVSRLGADQPPEDVAGDYGLTVPEVEEIRQAA